jgi:hypothetical protein
MLALLSLSAVAFAAGASAVTARPAPTPASSTASLPARPDTATRDSWWVARDTVATASRDSGRVTIAVVETVVASTVASATTFAASAPAVRPTTHILGRPNTTRAGRVRLEVWLAERTLVALQGADTLLVAPAGIGTSDTLAFGGRTWRFDTPTGRRIVVGKQATPVWVPPVWHYAEVAAKRGYRLAHLEAGRPVALGGGRRLVVRGERVGVVARDGSFAALPANEEIVFGGTVYVPPLGTANRRIPGQLGAYRLDMGDGYLIHGTPYESTVGTASSHGCVRLDSVALEWVYTHVPVGAAVTIK